MSFDKEHLRHCLLVAFHLKKTAAEARNMICTALGDNAVSYSTCKKWFRQFRTGNFDVKDADRPGQPKKVKDEELEALLEENPCSTLQELGQELGVTPQAISKRLHKLGKVRKKNRSIPYELKSESKN